MIKNKNIRLTSLCYKKLLFIFCLIPIRKSFGDVINHSSSERKDIFVLPWSKLSHFPVVELDNAIWFGTLSREPGFLWHGSNWAGQFVHFLQYTSGLEALACSIYTDFNYVITMLPPSSPGP